MQYLPILRRWRPWPFGLWLLVGNLVLTAAIALATLHTLQISESAHLHWMRQAVRNLADSVGAEVATELRLVDNALITIAGHTRMDRVGVQHLAPPGMQDEIATQQGLVPFVTAFRVTGLDGWVFQVRPGDAAVQISDRDYFRAALASDRAVVSEPVLSRFTGRWSLVLARRMTSAAGQPLGVVYAVIGSAHFSQLFSRFQLGSGGAISLRTGTGRLVARFTTADPGAPAGLGTDTVSPELHEILARDEVAGLYQAPTALDGIERINAYRRLPPYDLILLTGLSTQDIHAPIELEAWWTWWLTTAMLLLLWGGSGYVYRQHRRERRARLQVVQLAAEQGAMLSNDLVGILRLKNRTISWSNPASERMFGYPPGGLNGVDVRSLYPSTEAFEAFGRQAYEVLDSGRTFRGQVDLVRRDGQPLTVDVSGARLEGAGDEYLWMSLDITEMKRQHERIEHVAFHDGLTGLPNRALLMDRLHQAIELCRRTQELLVVCFLDLDGFKLVNDVHGHAAGDQLLQEVARRLAGQVRTHDTIARVGGDEFVVLMTALQSVDVAREAMNRIAAAIAAPVSLDSGHVVRVRASMGWAGWPMDGEDEDSLLTAADRAMYADKSAHAEDHGGRSSRPADLWGPELS